MKILCNIKLSNEGQIVYDENQSFNSNVECNDENIRYFISFIRPNLKYNYILYSYLRDLKLNEF
jgi:hypothetical protein